MQFTTDWILPTRVAQDDTVGDYSWVETDSIFIDDSEGFGDNSARNFFTVGGSSDFGLKYAHLVFNDLPVYANNEKSSVDAYPWAVVGGSSDLWGESSISGLQVSNEKFGVAFAIGDYNGSTYDDKSYYLVATGFEELYDLPDDVVIDGIEMDIDEHVYASGGGTQTIAVDCVKLRITYSWDASISAEASSYGGIFIDPPNRQLPQKKYRYKVYSDDGDYLGDWRDVSSNPSYKQDINNLIGAMPVSFARNDLSIEPRVDTLLNEDDSELTNEDDSPFLIDVTPVSALGAGTNLDTNYEVEVDAIYGQFEPLLNEDDTPILNEDGSMILVEEGYPLGRTIFRGYIPRWELPLSGSGITSEIRSYSQDLANEILTTEDTVYINNGTLDEGSYGINGGGPTDFTILRQTITVAAEKTFSKIRLYPSAGWYSDVEFSVGIFGGTYNSLGTSYGGGSGVVNRNDNPEYYDVVFEAPITLAAGSYVLDFTTPESKTGGNPTYPFNLGTSTAYGGGTLYYYTNDTGFVNSGDDIAFQLFEAGADTTVPFLSEDPSDILRAIVDFARGKGLDINYTDDSISDTGTTVSYTFRAQTIKEAIEKVLELCPAGWYYYYDFGTDTIYLKERSTTPDRWLRKGASVVSGKILKTIEQIVNDVLFSGGGDPALYVRRQDTTSIANIRRGLKKVSDNRVTTEATAIILADSEIDQYDEALYAGDVTITEDGEFYLEDVRVGEMLGFIGFGTLVDAIVVQSVSKDYNPDIMPLALTYNVPRVNKRVEDIKRNLDTLETTNNPDSPS